MLWCLWSYLIHLSPSSSSVSPERGTFNSFINSFPVVFDFHYGGLVLLVHASPSAILPIQLRVKPILSVCSVVAVRLLPRANYLSFSIDLLIFLRVNSSLPFCLCFSFSVCPVFSVVRIWSFTCMVSTGVDEKKTSNFLSWTLHSFTLGLVHSYHPGSLPLPLLFPPASASWILRLQARTFLMLKAFLPGSRVLPGCQEFQYQSYFCCPTHELRYLARSVQGVPFVLGAE